MAWDKVESGNGKDEPGIIELAQMTEDQARTMLEKIRWPEGVYCPHCGSVGVTALRGKKHRPGVYQCNDCRQQYTVTVGTIMHRSKLPLKTWIMAFYLMCSSKKGLSALQLQRQLRLGSYKTAWHLCHRVRHAMQNGPLAGMLGAGGGVVEADETYIGGKPRRGQKSVQGRGTSKTAVAALVDREGGVRAKVVERVDGPTLKGFVRDNVDPSATVCTDGFTSYKGLDQHVAGHESVNHSADEFVVGDIHVNTAESYFALIKRQYVGAHHHYSKKYMDRYVAETSFRWEHRKESDWERTVEALRQAPGVRLTYRPIGDRGGM